MPFKTAYRNISKNNASMNLVFYAIGCDSSEAIYMHYAIEDG